jgi:uroporphyrin-III C-methyltransferase
MKIVSETPNKAEQTSAEASTQTIAAAMTATTASPKRDTPKATPTPSKKQGFNVVLLWLIVVLLLAAVGFGSIYLVRQLQMQQVGVESVRAQLVQQKAELDMQQRLAADNLEKAIVEQQLSLQSSLDDLAERVESNNGRLLSLSSVNRDEWKLQEAQYLLRLADQRLLLEQDSQNALALAISADDVLRDVDRAELMPVRKLLAEDIAVLKMSNLVDREGIFLRLAALGNQIDAIPFVEPLGVQEALLEAEEIPESETLKQQLTRKFYSLLHKLSAYVRVRDHGRATNAVLPPAEQKYLQQNLRLMLEQAQVALLRNEAQIYVESLVKAQNWINQYYSLNVQAKAAVDELVELQEAEVAPELTNFNNSASALAEFIEKQNKVAAARRGVRP